MYSPAQLHTLPDSELVTLCLHQERRAWEEFFKRFSPLIKKTIYRMFIKFNKPALADNFDNILDIHAILVERLYAKGILNQCPEVSGIRAWLTRITANQTLDWLRTKGRIKNLPLEQTERVIKSLSTPLGEDDDSTTLEDLIEDERADMWVQLEQETVRRYTECVINQIGYIDNVTHRWILRLHILGQMAISEIELEQLGAVSSYSREELEAKLNDMETKLDQQVAERQETLGKAVLYWHQLRDIEIKTTRLGKDTFTDHSQQLEALKQEWQHLDRQRSAALAGSRSFPSPTNKEIADLLGIPETQCGNVSQYLKRARATLSRKIQTVTKNS